MITITVPFWVIVVAIVYLCIQVAFNAIRIFFAIKAAHSEVVKQKVWELRDEVGK